MQQSEGAPLQLEIELCKDMVPLGEGVLDAGGLGTQVKKLIGTSGDGKKQRGDRKNTSQAANVIRTGTY